MNTQPSQDIEKEMKMIKVRVLNPCLSDYKSCTTLSADNSFRPLCIILSEISQLFKCFKKAKTQNYHMISMIPSFNTFRDTELTKLHPYFLKGP